MTNLPTICRLGMLGVLLSSTLFTGGAVEADQGRLGQEFARKASWTVPTPQSVRDLAIEWLATREARRRGASPA